MLQEEIIYMSFHKQVEKAFIYYLLLELNLLRKDPITLHCISQYKHGY